VAIFVLVFPFSTGVPNHTTFFRFPVDSSLENRKSGGKCFGVDRTELHEILE